LRITLNVRNEKLITVGGKTEQKAEKMCGITVNGKESGGNDSKVNDLKLQDSTRATLVSEFLLEEKCLWHNNMLDNDVENNTKNALICSYCVSFGLT
jgi:hypothetical protein